MMYPLMLLFAGLYFISIVEASGAMGYEVITFYQAYKIDFLVNGNDRKLGKSCGRNGDTSMLGNFNDFASCYLDRRGARPRTYIRDPRGETTAPVLKDVGPNLKLWGFLSGNPGKLVEGWGGPTQNQDPFGHGDVVQKTLGIVKQAQSAHPDKVNAADVAKMDASFDETIKIRWKENREGMLANLEKKWIAKWTRDLQLPAGTVEANKLVEYTSDFPDGYDVLDTDDPLKFHEGLPDAKKADVRAKLDEYVAGAGGNIERNHAATLEKIKESQQFLKEELC